MIAAPETSPLRRRFALLSTGIALVQAAALVPAAALLPAAALAAATSPKTASRDSAAHATHAPAAHAPAAPEPFYHLKYADSLSSVNDRCVVTHNRLNPAIHPLYVNGRPVGFC